MDRTTTGSRSARIVAIAVIVSLISGCAAASKATDWLRGKSTESPDDAVILGAPDADAYLDELYELSSSGPAKQADIFADASSAAQLTPGPNSSLRLGLVLATPGHAESNPEQAQSVLREVLARSELLSSAEVSLATIHLRNVESLIVTTTEAQRLRETSSRAARTEEQAISQRLADVEAENRRLRNELEDAEQKLEAITSIERSIREQE